MVETLEHMYAMRLLVTPMFTNIDGVPPSKLTETVCFLAALLEVLRRKELPTSSHPWRFPNCWVSSHFLEGNFRLGIAEVLNVPSDPFFQVKHRSLSFF